MDWVPTPVAYIAPPSKNALPFVIMIPLKVTDAVLVMYITDPSYAA